jgi:ATP phosphoribosyltransferase regulatory subunit HisZ
LVIQKAIAGRAKDLQHVEALLIAQFNKLDYEYIESWLIQFAEALEQPGLVGDYHKLRDQATTIHHQYHE